MNITSKNAAQTAIAWAATNKATCSVPVRILGRVSHEKLETLAAASGVTVTLSLPHKELQFRYDPSRNPQSHV
jgi:hypothetical protein